MRDSVPALKKNPWLIIQEPLFVHNYLDSLTETINNLAKYKDQLDKVRVARGRSSLAQRSAADCWLACRSARCCKMCTRPSSTWASSQSTRSASPALVATTHTIHLQPAFYISNPQTIKRFVRLLGQVRCANIS